MALLWMWGGAPNPEGFTVRAKLTAPATTVALRVSPNPDLSGAVSIPATPTPELVATFTASGLAFNTRYYYVVDVDGVADLERIGQIRTHPPLDEPADVTIVAGGDAGNYTGAPPLYQGTGAELAPTRISNHPIFDTITELEPAEVWHLGDLAYYDPGSGVHVPDSSVGTYRRMYDDVMLQTRQAQLYRSTGVRYVWDDHDFGPNDSDSTSPGRDNACQVYREVVPHGPLGAGMGTGPIYQAWQIGRVQIVMWDSRADRSPNTNPQSVSKTMLGSAQKAWFADILATTTAKALIIISPSQWFAPGNGDSWDSFSDEQAWVIDRINTLGWGGKTIILGADVHSLAIDTGTNSPGNIPVFQFSSFDANPSAMKDYYDTGASLPGRGQYGMLRMLDLGHEIRLIGTCMVGTAAWRSHTHVVPVPTDTPIETDPLPPPIEAREASIVQWAGFDASSGKLIADLPDMTGGFGRRIGSYSSATLSLPRGSGRVEPLWQATQPARTILVPILNGLPAGGYMPLIREPQGGTMTIAAVSLEGYFDRRKVRSHVWVDADPITVIAAGLIRDAEDINGVGQGLGFLLDTTASGQSWDRTYVPTDRASIYTALQEIQDDDGGEWTVDVVWQDSKQTAITPIARVKPRIGRTTTALFESKSDAQFETLADAAVRYSLREDYSTGRGANYVIAYGTGEGSDQPESDPAVATDLLDNGWPLFEDVFTPGSNITEIPDLDSHAETKIRYFSLGTTTWTLTSKWDAYPMLVKDWALGDDVSWNLKSDWHPDGVTGTGRVIGWDLHPEARTVDVTVWTPGEAI